MEVWQSSNLQPLRLGKEKKKKKERKKKPQGKSIMVCPLPYGDHNNYRPLIGSQPPYSVVASITISEHQLQFQARVIQQTALTAAPSGGRISDE